MPAPTNVSFATATDLTSIPQTITQRVDNAGTTYTVYYRIPASLVTTAMAELGVFGFGDLAVYTPTTTFYKGPAAATTQVVIGRTDPAGLNVPIQVPVEAATEYFVKVATNAGNPTPANLTLLVQAAPDAMIRQGDIVVPDDTVGYPLIALEPTQDYVVRKFVHPFSASEQGDVLHTSGRALMLREPTGTTLDKLALYDNAYAYLSTISFSPAIGNTEPYIRTNQTTQRFWVIYFNDPTTYAFSVDASGVTSTVEDMGDVYGNAGEAPGPVTTSPDESIIYWAVRSDSKIYAWDLVNHVAIGTFKAAVASYRVGDLLTLSNGEILVGYWKSSATLDYNVKHFAADGTLLHTYNFGSDIRSITPRLAHSIDNLTSFWVYLPRIESVGGANRGKSNVYQVQISDGTYLTSRVYAMYERGEYKGVATATPLASFGPSNSCPFWIAGTRGVATQTFTIRRQRRFLLPSSDDNKTMQIPTLELLMRTGIGLTAGPSGSPVQGEDPQVMLRISKDGGKTWGNERWVTAGAIGRYADRVRWLRATGNYRNAVCEITVSDPVDWQFLAMLGTPVEGNS